MFHALSFGKIGQPPITGLPANVRRRAPARRARAGLIAATAGECHLTVTRRAFAQRLRRHGRTA